MSKLKVEKYELDIHHADVIRDALESLGRRVMVDLQTHAYTDEERIGREERLKLIREALGKVLFMLSADRYKKENAMEIIISNYSKLPWSKKMQ